jgi:dihydrofolate reductase
MINAIFATDLNGGLGFEGTLPWPHNSEDMAQFQRMTSGHIVVMGRRTWDDPKMPKPLFGRKNYVVSNSPLGGNYYQTQVIGGGDYVDQIVKLHDANPGQDVFVIGGKQILEDCKGILDKVYLTYLRGNYRIDTRIHLKNFLSGFTERYASSGKSCTFVRYEAIFKRPPTSP